MSAHDEHGDAPDEGHDDHAFDAEPATTLSPGEPTSPLWLPVAGLVFFALVGLWSMTGDDEEPAAKPEPKPTPVAAAPAPRPAAPAATGKRPALMRPQPGGVPDVRQKLSPETVELLKKRLEAQRAKKK